MKFGLPIELASPLGRSGEWQSNIRVVFSEAFQLPHGIGW